MFSSQPLVNIQTRLLDKFPKLIANFTIVGRLVTTIRAS